MNGLGCFLLAENDKLTKNRQRQNALYQQGAKEWFKGVYGQSIMTLIKAMQNESRTTGVRCAWMMNGKKEMVGIGVRAHFLEGGCPEFVRMT